MELVLRNQLKRVYKALQLSNTAAEMEINMQKIA